jgi:hypothetical protein
MLSAGAASDDSGRAEPEGQRRCGGRRCLRVAPPSMAAQPLVRMMPRGPWEVRCCVGTLVRLTSRAVRLGSEVNRSQLFSRLDAARPLLIRAAEHLQIKQDHALLTSQPAAQSNSSHPYDPTKCTAIHAFLTFCPKRKVEMLEAAQLDRRQSDPSSRSPTKRLAFDQRITPSWHHFEWHISHPAPKVRHRTTSTTGIAMAFGSARSHAHHIRNKSFPASSPPKAEQDRLPAVPHDPAFSPW